MNGPVHRIALLLEYDGGRLAGSQLQKDALTVQGILEDAVEKATGARARVAFAGRTDAGVHATGQVAAFLTASRLDIASLQRALNAWLPSDVVVRAAANVDTSFDPRRDALRRHYLYVIDNGAVRPALGRHRAWHVRAPLDIGGMADAARSVTGRRDFAAFAGALERPAAGSVRLLHAFEVRRLGRRIQVIAVADAFLPHQVRRMTGALVQVGLGRLTPGGYEALLDGPPSSAGPAAPAHGLYLTRVDYDRDPFAGLDWRRINC